MGSISRRAFLKGATVATMAAGAGTFSINVAGANDKVVLGVMGIRGRGNDLAKGFGKRSDVTIKYLCDVDSNLFGQRVPELEKATGQKPKTVQDFRKMLDDKEIDGVVMATPNHWHALGTIWACQAGKDVYVEKPASHNIWEGRKMVEAARKYQRVVQVGTQNRSAPYCMQAAEYIKAGKLGDVHFVRVMNSKLRNTIGNPPDEDKPPEGVDYDMWLGPAPNRKFNKNHFHYAWNWFWVYGSGDIANDGVHQIDLARWAIGATYPKSVYSTGGMFFYTDAQETPDTHIVNWDFDTMTVVFEQSLWSPYLRKTPFEKRNDDELPDWPTCGTRIEIYGTKGFMYLGRHGDGWQVFDNAWKPKDLAYGRFTNDEHFANFVDCIRSRQRPNADIEDLHLSTLWGHYGNISYRLGRKLFIDPQTEMFVNDDEANRDLICKRPYREPWVVPEQV